MARPRYPKQDVPLPAPLPPETRTVGQLVAETIRFYGDRFWTVVPLGLPVLVVSQITVGLTTALQALVLAACGPLMAAAYVRASILVGTTTVSRGAAVRAIAIGALVWVPAPFLTLVFVLPAVAWLALVGLVVPVLALEQPTVRAAFRRAIELARADYIHALGSLATLVLVFGLVRLMLVLLLRDLGDSGERAALGLADLVLSPLLFVGGAILYVDQAARVRSGPRPKER
ncbi:MAG: hypothetical protein MSC30_18850 [Gaiellaceae bacterium MAG52_C11]|nr:hypothetical protein [Candidatus Gaiellasilicea maunaloa]